jgi:tetratricopeptide (TPR) repeat protein
MSFALVPIALTLSCLWLNPSHSSPAATAPCVGTQATATPGVPRKQTAREQLEHATRQKRKLRGASGKARNQARKAAVDAYRSVRSYFPKEFALVAEASFRAGELLRSAKEGDLALAEFEHAQLYGKGIEFRARAGLEIGHIHRRAGRMMRALEAYEAVESLGEDWAEERDMAAFWQGRAQQRLQRPKDARRCFERAARKGVNPVERVRAFDAWGMVLVEAKDLEAAAGVLELCRKSLAEHAAQKTTLGLRVRGALDAMRSPLQIAKGVEQRHRGRPGQ